MLKNGPHEILRTTSMVAVNCCLNQRRQRLNFRTAAAQSKDIYVTVAYNYPIIMKPLLLVVPGYKKKVESKGKLGCFYSSPQSFIITFLIR